MAEQTIDQLNIEINTKTKQSSSGMDKLIASIEKLKTVTGDGVGELTGIAASIQKLTSMLSGMKSQSGIVSSLANSINKLNDVKTDHISASIETLKKSLQSLGGMDSGLKTIVSDLATLSRSSGGGTAMDTLKLQAQAAKTQATIDKSALTSAKAQEGLKAIAERNKQIEETARAAAECEKHLLDMHNQAKLQKETLPTDSVPYQQVVPMNWKAYNDYSAQVASELEAAMNEGYNRLTPKGASVSSEVENIGKAAKVATEEVASGSKKTSGFVNRLKDSFSGLKDQIGKVDTRSNSFFSMGRFYGWYFILRQIANTFGGFINNINSYIENMNLFDVAMGESAQSGEKLTQSLQNVLGVDSGEAMRYMGVFEELGTSFSIANKQATIMSENLTQLGYDFASFYNISTKTSFEKLESVYTGQSRAARSLGIDISNARLQQELYNLGINEKVNNLTQADKAELRYIAIMKQSVNAQGDMARTIQTPANALRVLQAQLQITGRAIGSIFIPALEAILPPVTAVIEVIGDLASELASFFGFKMSKIDYSSLNTGFSGVADDADKAANGVGNIGKKAKESKKQLDNLISGFDELNILQINSETDVAAAGAGAAGNPGNILSSVDLPQYDALKGAIANQITNLKNQIKKALADITAIVSGALLAVGAILVLTGANIPLGLGLMAAGAVGLAADIALNWDAMTTPLLNTLTTITAATGGFFLALGAIMAFSGANIPLGIGLMAAGAISLATSVAIDWNSQKTQISTVLSGITGLISGSLLAVGGMLAFTGANAPLGIGLMAAGAVGLASAVALNWSSMDKQTKETLSTVTATVSGSMLAVGALLTLSGTSPVLGISMMAVGASALATTIAVNWDSMSNQLRDTLTTITSVVGGFSLALGAALTFSGANLALGIPLLITGAGSLATAISLNWDKTGGNINDALTKITLAVGASSLAIGAALPLGIALMAAGAASLATATMLNWDTMPKQTKDTLTKMTLIVGTSLLALGAVLTFTGVAAPLGIGMMVAGAAGLATAAVINWDSIKDKVKNVLADIFSIVSAASVAVGVMLCLTGAGIPLGLGMIISGAAGIWKAHEISSNPITDYIRNMMNGIIGIVESGVNFCIDKLNSLSWTVPDWVPKIGGNKWGFDISEIHIPRLATGNVAYKPIIAEFGEYSDANTNPEITAPQSIIRETVTESNEGMVAVLAQILEVAQKIAEKDTTVNLDGKKISDSNNKYNANRGYNLGLQST